MSNQSKLSYMDNKPQTSSSMMRKHHQFSLSTSTLLKNNAFVNNLIKASRPQTQAQQKYQSTASAPRLRRLHSRHSRRFFWLFFFGRVPAPSDTFFADESVNSTS